MPITNISHGIAVNLHSIQYFMERIRINLPTEFTFSTTIPVRITDINYGNHLGNQVFLEMVHEARVQFLKHHGYTELAMEGVSLIMADAAIEYKGEVFYGDTIEVEMAMGGASRVGFDLLYQLHAIRNGEKTLAAKAKTGLICYNYELRKTVALPQAAADRMSGEESINSSVLNWIISGSFFAE